MTVSHFLKVYKIHFELMSLEAQLVLSACRDDLSCFDLTIQRCFPLAVSQVSSVGAPSGMNFSFLKRISSSRITL